MSASQWHRCYASQVAVSPERLFDLVADMPNSDRWLPPSDDFARTTEVEPYPVRRGSRYRDGKPGESGKEWWGSVTGFERPGSIDFHHTIHVRQLRTTIDVHIHYSFEEESGATIVGRWLLLDFSLPIVFRPIRPLITSRFDRENLRMLDALKRYAEAQPDEPEAGRGD